MAAFAIKAPPVDIAAGRVAFYAAKTMFGGKAMAAGDTIFLFAGARDGGSGLTARGVVGSAVAVDRTTGVARQTPRVSIIVERLSPVHGMLCRRESKPFDRWYDGRPETELNFKLYRQATDKIIGLSDRETAVLERVFA